MDHWYHVETRKDRPFDLVLDWTYEHVALRDMFDVSVFDIADMEDRCNRYVDTHYIARVTVLYDGVEMGQAMLGSCYASGCDPADDMRSGISGYLEDMIQEALTEARDRATVMLERLKHDFLGEYDAA